MDFNLSINMDNAAFLDNEGGAAGELANILHAMTDRILDGADFGFVRDTNGNTVGSFEIVAD